MVKLLKKMNDSEVKFLYNFINVHLLKGDYEFERRMGLP